MAKVPVSNWIHKVRCTLALRTRARRLCHIVLRKCGFLPGEDWRSGLSAELKGWEEFLRDPARKWVLSEYQNRVDPGFELQPCFRELIGAPEGAQVRILDVGAGPLTSVGKKWGHRNVQLVPLDPLGDEYKAMLARLNIHPPVLPEPGHAERLLERFEKNSFDLAIAHNSLDHSYDPLLAIRQMLTVVKPSCYVYLWHFANEGQGEGYRGLHQWNFGIKRGDMILNDGRSRYYSLSKEFQGLATLECESEPAFGRTAVIAKIKKLRPS